LVQCLQSFPIYSSDHSSQCSDTLAAEDCCYVGNVKVWHLLLCCLLTVALMA